eukprot:9823532-Lingulodinium_polyedra.AAC.1
MKAPPEGSKLQCQEAQLRPRAPSVRVGAEDPAEVVHLRLLGLLGVVLGRTARARPPPSGGARPAALAGPS